MKNSISQLVRDPQAVTFLVAVLLGGGLAAWAATRSWEVSFIVALGVLLVLLFAWKPVIGLYVIALLYPFINLEFVRGDLNIPYVDLIALMAFSGWFGRSIWLWIFQGKKMSWKQFPGFLFFLAFVAASFLSIINADDTVASFKYVLRPLSFFYLMFVVYPLNTITTPKILLRIFRIFYALGVITAMDGLLGFLTYRAQSVLAKRAVPASMFGLYPWGNSHNLISEVLISVIPIGLLLVWFSKNEWSKKWLFLGTVFMLVVNLLTFSRTGWITMGVEFFIFGFMLYRYKLKDMARGLVIMGALFAPVLAYMLIFSSQSFVQSSDQNRMLLNTIAYNTWRDFPIIGAGAGTFTAYVAKNTVYNIEFGDPLDAHGFIQKIAAEEGTLGLVTYLAVLCFVLMRMWKTYRTVQADQQWSLIILACFALSAGTIVFQLFQPNYFLSKMWFPLGIALASSHLALKYHNKTP